MAALRGLFICNDHSRHLENPAKKFGYKFNNIVVIMDHRTQGAIAMAHSQSRFIPLFRAGLMILVLPAPAFALMNGSGVDANTSDSPWAGVVSITASQGGTYSGALIGDRYVLTAAHVVYGNRNTPGNLIFNLNYGGNLTQQITGEAVFIHPSYTTGNTSSDSLFAWNDDIAVVRLSSPVVSGVPTYSVFTGSLSDKREVTMVAYGGSGDGASGTVTSGSNPTVKRVGRNRVDVLLPDDEGSGQSEVHVFDFDGPNASTNVYGNPNDLANLTLGASSEAQYAGGDSGSPIFVNDNGIWKIAGIGAFNGGTELVCDKDAQGKLSNCINTKFGSIGGGMVVAPYAGWIQAQMVSQVPEADTWAMLLAGLGLLAGFAQTRQKR